MALNFLSTKVRANYHMGKHQAINWPVNHPEMLLSKEYELNVWNILHIKKLTDQQNQPDPTCEVLKYPSLTER